MNDNYTAETERLMEDWAKAKREARKYRSIVLIGDTIVAALWLALILAALLVLTGCGTTTPGTDTPTKQQQVQDYLTGRGMPTIKPDRWTTYEQETVKTCENTNPYFLPALARQVDGTPEVQDIIRAGISVYCPERLSEWDQATR